MYRIAKRILLVGAAWVASLLLAAAPARAQVPTVTNTYAAKFICGVQPDAAITSMPDAQAGRYSTKINVHNNTGIDIRFRKKVIQLRGGQVPFEPSFRRDESLRPDWAMEVVCRDIYSHLNITLPPTAAFLSTLMKNGSPRCSDLIIFLKNRFAAGTSRLAPSMNSITGVRGAAAAYSRRLSFATVAARQAQGGACRAGVTNHEPGACLTLQTITSHSRPRAAAPQRTRG